MSKNDNSNVDESRCQDEVTDHAHFDLSAEITNTRIPCVIEPDEEALEQISITSYRRHRVDLELFSESLNGVVTFEGKISQFEDSVTIGESKNDALSTTDFSIEIESASGHNLRDETIETSISQKVPSLDSTINGPTVSLQLDVRNG